MLNCLLREGLPHTEPAPGGVKSYAMFGPIQPCTA